MRVAKLFYKSRIHGQSLPSCTNKRPTNTLVQVQQLLTQNDEADTNTNDFKQAITTFKQDFKTLPTTWRVKFFLPLREGDKKPPKQLFRVTLMSLQKDRTTWLPMLAESCTRWHRLKVPSLSPAGTADMQATAVGDFSLYWKHQPSPPRGTLHSLGWGIHLVQICK